MDISICFFFIVYFSNIVCVLLRCTSRFFNLTLIISKSKKKCYHCFILTRNYIRKILVNYEIMSVVQ